MKKEELVKIFKEMADVEDFLGEPFKAHTYRFASETVEKVGLDVEKLRGIKGIGKAILDKTNEFIESGKIRKHTQLMELVPAKYKKKIFSQDARRLGKEWKDEIKRRFFNEDGSLKTMPSKYSLKFYVLKEITYAFKKGQLYDENEVNAILAPIWDDHISLRRYLIDFGFVKRSKDGSSYKRSV
jgi:hypothetical protein